MRVNLEEVSYIAGLVGIIVAGTWRLSQQKAEILRLVGIDLREINETLNSINLKLSVHMTEYANREQLTDYKLGTIEGSIESHSKRCQQQIREIKGFLERDTNYKARDSLLDG